MKDKKLFKINSKSRYDKVRLVIKISFLLDFLVLQLILIKV